MSEPLAPLIGQRIRRVDVPQSDLVALTLTSDHVLLLSTANAASGIGLAQERPRGRPAEGVAKQLRNAISGARIESALALPGAIAFDLRRGPDRVGLVFDESPPNVLVLDDDSRIVLALHPGRLADRSFELGGTFEPRADAPLAEPFETLEALELAGAALLEERRSAHDDALRIALDRALRRAHGRATRRAEATLADIDRAAMIPTLRARASALLAALHSIPRHATQFEVTDWSATPPRVEIVAIDPELGAQRTIDGLFVRARKLEAGVAIATRRHDEANTEADAIAALLTALRETPDELSDALIALAAEARGLGVIIDVAKPKQKKREPQQHRPYREYRGHGNRAIYVGKGAADNDLLTFHVARPHDLWLHVRGMRGSHVVIPLAKNEACPTELLIDAAHLTAHFSSVRNETTTEVQYTLRKHVKKIKGGPAGRVHITEERTFVLRVDRARIDALLKPVAETEHSR